MLDAFRNDIIEIIFERKNKNYGAYSLRKFYPRTVTRSGIISILAFILLMSSPMIAKYFKEEAEKTKDEKKKKRTVEVMTPPPLDSKTPPPVVIPPPPKLKMQQFTPPKIVEDDKVNVEHQIEENKDLKTADTKTQEGEDKIVIPDNVEVTQVVVEDNKILDEKEVDEKAVYPKLYDYLGGEIEYPAYEKDAGIEGSVYVRFVVELNGSLSGITVVKSVSKGLDDEAVRVLQKISGPGKWTPAKAKGKPVRAYYVLPINYKIEE